MRYKKYITILEAAIGITPLNKRELLPEGRHANLWQHPGEQTTALPSPCEWDWEHSCTSSPKHHTASRQRHSKIVIPPKVTSQVASVRSCHSFKTMCSCHVLAKMYILLAMFLQGFKKLYLVELHEIRTSSFGFPKKLKMITCTSAENLMMYNRPPEEERFLQ